MKPNTTSLSPLQPQSGTLGAVQGPRLSPLVGISRTPCRCCEGFGWLGRGRGWISGWPRWRGPELCFLRWFQVVWCAQLPWVVEQKCEDSLPGEERQSLKVFGDSDVGWVYWKGNRDTSAGSVLWCAWSVQGVDEEQKCCDRSLIWECVG